MNRIRAILSVSAVLVATDCKNPAEPQVRAGHPRGILSDSLAASGRPHGVAIATNGRFCISQIDANAVSCGELTATTARFDLLTYLPLGVSPAHVAVNSTGTEAFTADQGSGTASFVSIAAAKTIATTQLTSGGFNLLLNPNTPRVYVTTASGDLHIVDTDSHSVLGHLSVGSAANGLALDAAAGRLYVSSRDAGTVTAIDLRANTIVRTYAVAALPQRIALSNDGRTLYIATEAAGLEYLDLETGTHVAVSGVKAGAVGLALSPDNQRLYITNPPLGSLQIVDVATRTVVQTIDNLGVPRNVAFGLQGAAALVANEVGSVYVIR